MAEDLPSVAYRFEDCEPKIYKGTHSLKATAHHEAAHAVMCRLVHRHFATIVMGNGAAYVGHEETDMVAYFHRVKSKDESFLKTKPLGFHGELLRPVAVRKIVVFLAGMQAELLLDGSPLECELFRDDFDHRNARQLCEEAFGHSHLRYFQALTRDHLSRCWVEVERTANELLARFDRYGFAAIRLSNPRDASFFARDNLPVRWTDENWS